MITPIKSLASRDFPRISDHGNFVTAVSNRVDRSCPPGQETTTGQMGEAMPAFESNAPSKLISIVVRVYAMGPLYVRYELLSGKMPHQLPAVFADREQLAMQLRELGLFDEAALVTLWDDEADFKFQVVSSRALMESFGFDHPEKIH